MSTESEFMTRALELPADKRAELARRLLLSLEPADFDADAEDAWEAEIEARLDAADRTNTPPTDWRIAIERIQASLQRKPGR